MANSLFKAYAKQAKKRLKEGFWSDVKNQRNYFELVAATNGGSADFAVNRQMQALKNQLYNREHSAEEEFYRRVCGILSGDEVVTNPIARLMDSEAASQMSPQQKNTYMLQLSAKYQRAVERYENEKRQGFFIYENKLNGDKIS
ncbi:MAG: hypothetical protein ACLUG1_00195 [Christensenellales bacterium]